MAGVLVVFGLPGLAVSGASRDMIRLAGGPGDTNINLVVRQFTVTPVRAHIGDKIHIEVRIENMAEGSNTTTADLYSNGNLIGRKFFTGGRSPRIPSQCSHRFALARARPVPSLGATPF